MATRFNPHHPVHPRWQRSALSAALACTLLVGAIPAHAAPGTAAASAQHKLQLNIPAQPLRQALLVFSQQSGQNVLLDGNVDASLRSTSVVGSYSAEEGLGRLLQGSGYNFARTDAATLYLVPSDSAQADGTVNLAPTQIQYQLAQANGRRDAPRVRRPGARVLVPSAFVPRACARGYRRRNIRRRVAVG